MDDFADCIINNQPTSVPGEMGLRDVRTMMALYESARTGRTVSWLRGSGAEGGAPAAR